MGQKWEKLLFDAALQVPQIDMITHRQKQAIPKMLDLTWKKIWKVWWNELSIEFEKMYNADQFENLYIFYPFAQLLPEGSSMHGVQTKNSPL